MSTQTFKAVAVVTNSTQALKALNDEAQAHFGHSNPLHARNIRLVGTHNGYASQFIASADFTEQDPDA